MTKLLVTDSNGRSFEFPLIKEEIKIGRSANRNDLVLPSKQVSIIHATLSQIDSTDFLLKDLASTNGTYVQQQRIEESWLSEGDSFSIANFTIRLIASTENESQNRIPLTRRSLVRPSGLFTGLLDVFQEQLEPINQHANQREILEAKLEEKVKTLEMLYAFGRTLSSVFDIDKIFAQIVELLFQVTPTERVAILTWDETNDLLQPCLISFRPDAGQSLASSTLNVSQTITRMVIKEKVAVLSDDLHTDDRFIDVDSVAHQSVHSVMCVPMIGKERVLGVIYVDKLGLSNTFTSEDLDLLNVVAAQAAIAVDNASAYEQLSREAVRRASYQRFLPGHVVDSILQSPQDLKLGGVTQFVTILFADIRNFSTMAEKSEPEVVVYVLNRFLSAMTDVIFAHDGTLDKFLGDGLMALFGAPYQGSEDVQNAVNAAIGMQRRLLFLNSDLQRYGFQPIEIGVGINCGEVIVGYIGSEMRMDYTAVGNAVNLAARLTKQANGRQILISEDMRKLIGTDFETNEVTGVNLKGVSNVPDIFEIIYS